MLKHLRLKLTLLYLATAAALAVLVSGSAYWLLYYYFQSTNDDTLKYKMSDMFTALEQPLPAELASVRQSWLARRSIPTLSKEKDDREHASSPVEVELSDIFVFPLDRSGQLLFNPNPFAPPMAPDIQAAKAALQSGSDLRTVTLADGTPVRLLSYALPATSGVDVIQLGRSISDQMNVLRQLLGGLLLLGAISVAGLGAGSWWLAGQTLEPTQRSWERQQTFVANASHELRTPLTLIRASAEMARRHTPAGSSQVALLDDVIGESDHMTRLVEDLLLLSRLDAKKLKLERQNINLGELADDLRRQFERVAEAQGVRLEVETPAVEVVGDRTRLRQVLLILLDNALNHTPTGGAVKLAAAAQKNGVRVSVSDTGSGIPAEHLPHIFERFYQAENSSRGAGLGLSIAKALVEAQGGQIGVLSEDGKGTRVWLLLPGARKTRIN